MRLRTSAVVFSFSIVVLGLILGCSGSDRPRMVPVSGIVTYNGKPFEGDVITFSSPDSSRPAGGKTDVEGRYKLYTFEEFDGAVLGQHEVTISKPDPSQKGSSEIKEVEVGGSAGGSDAPSGAGAFKAKSTMPTQISPPGPGTKLSSVNSSVNSLLPVKYAVAKTSGLTAKVEAGKENKFDFSLTDE